MKHMKNRRTYSVAIRRMVMMAMFTALAYAAMLVIHIKVGFLTMDVKDSIITLCGLFFGPVSALVISVVVPLLELVTMSTTGVYGLIMNILGSVTFSITVSLFYKWRRSLWGAIVGLLSGALLMTAVMLLANLLITPYYMGTTAAAVRQLIPTLLFPFNLLKGIINVGAVLLLYKPLSRALHRLGIISGNKTNSVLLANGGKQTAEPVANTHQNTPRLATKCQKWKTSLLVTLAAVVLIVLSLVLIITVLGGTFTFGM